MESQGEPENQLRAPFERLFEAYEKIISRPLKIIGEAVLHESLGKPDFAVYLDNAIIGYVELKAPGKGANPDLFKSHDKEQWDRFRQVPNILYVDGNEWALYQNGELAEQRLRYPQSSWVRVDGRALCRRPVSLFSCFNFERSDAAADRNWDLFDEYTRISPCAASRP